MKNYIVSFLVFCCSFSAFSQKDSLQLGDKYAEDQLYFSVAYAQLYAQPSSISKSNFSYALSAGFLKDFTINKKGSLAFAAGFGLGYDFFNHNLKVDELNENTVFAADNTISNNTFKTLNIEFPLELRWRTSTAKKYSFWRVYSGVKFIYNLKNSFRYLDTNNVSFASNNVSAYNKIQAGLTFSAGYDAFNIHLFYGLQPIFSDAVINTSEVIDTKILKFGLIYYFL